MPPIAFPPSSAAKPQSYMIANHQSSSTSNPPSFSINSPLWSLPTFSLALSILAILILFLRHLVTSQGLVHRLLNRRQTNPSGDIQRSLPPTPTRSLKPLLPPPLPIPTIRRHSYPLTINDNSNTMLSPSPSPSPSPSSSPSSPSSLVNNPSAKPKRYPAPRRPGGLMRQDMREDVNGCRRHVVVFCKKG